MEERERERERKRKRERRRSMRKIVVCIRRMNFSRKRKNKYLWVNG